MGLKEDLAASIGAALKPYVGSIAGSAELAENTAATIGRLFDPAVEVRLFDYDEKTKMATYRCATVVPRIVLHLTIEPPAT